VSKYRGSGLTLKEFARRHGLSAGQLHYWVYSQANGPAAAETGVVFQEMRLSQAAITPVPWTAEVGLPNGTTVRLTRGTDREWTKGLVECLSRL
jgi:transposase-like protein